MISTKDLIQLINKSESIQNFKDLNWRGSLADYKISKHGFSTHSFFQKLLSLVFKVCRMTARISLFRLAFPNKVFISLNRVASLTRAPIVP